MKPISAKCGSNRQHQQNKTNDSSASSLLRDNTATTPPPPPQFVRHFLSEYPQTRCLNGSSAAYYYRPGFESGRTKWYVFHQGGGWCGPTLDNRWQRSQGDLGSSTSYPPTLDYHNEFFSTDPLQNPLTYNWNHVYLKYCDGGSFAGQNETATY